MSQRNGTPLPIQGLFETHLTVSDLTRSVAFYRDVVGLPLALELPERGAAFFWIPRPGDGLLGLWSLGSAPIGLSLHVAFAASAADVMAACGRLRSLGVIPLSFFGTETDEPSVIAWMPAAAVYFRDPDGHLLEYLAMLDSEPDADGGIVRWSEWAAGTESVERRRIELHTGSRQDLRPLFALAEDSPAALDSYLCDGEVLVAIEDESVVGHLQLVDGREPARAEIKNMAVAATHRRRGIGRRLVEAAVSRARARNCTLLEVATAAADVGNSRFYQRCGFRLRSVERNVFTTDAGYPADIRIDGIELRDRVWLDLEVTGPGDAPS